MQALRQVQVCSTLLFEAALPGVLDNEAKPVWIWAGLLYPSWARQLAGRSASVQRKTIDGVPIGSVLSLSLQLLAAGFKWQVDTSRQVASPQIKDVVTQQINFKNKGSTSLQYVVSNCVATYCLKAVHSFQKIYDVLWSTNALWGSSNNETVLPTDWPTDWLG